MKKLLGFTLAEVFHPAGQSKKIAFTLAEVLITLGIIGVVAALTMPTLIANHRKKVVETRLAKFYSTINQAIVMSEVDNGDRKGWLPMYGLTASGEIGSEGEITTEEWYKKYLAKYLKVVKAEPSPATTEENKYDLYFPDGSMVTFSGSSWVFYPEAKYYTMITDEDSGVSDRNREVTGKYCFTFLFKPYDPTNKNLYNKGVEPYVSAANLTDDYLKHQSSVGCYSETSNERAFCTELIRRNGWKIPDDYPWIK